MSCVLVLEMQVCTEYTKYDPFVLQAPYDTHPYKFLPRDSVLVLYIRVIQSIAIVNTFVEATHLVY